MMKEIKIGSSVAMKMSLKSILYHGILLVLFSVPLQKTTAAQYVNDIHLQIIDGIHAEPGQFPYLVGVFTEFLEGTFFCGGSLVSQNYVLTAAHSISG